MNIIVHLPQSPEAIDSIRNKAAKCQAKLIIDSINDQNISKKDKERLLDEVIKKISTQSSGT